MATRKEQPARPAPIPSGALASVGVSLNPVQTLALVVSMRRIGAEWALLQLAREHGPIVHFRMMHRRIIMCCDPDAMQHVLGRGRAAFSKGESYAEVRKFLGDGLITAEGQAWREMRRVAQPHFSRRVVESMTPTMQRTAEQFARSHVGPRFDAREFAAGLVGDVLMRTLLGDASPTDSAQSRRDMAAALAFVAERTAAIVRLPMAVPTQRHRDFRHAMQRLRKTLRDIVEHARRDPPPEDSLLRAIVDSTPDDQAASDQVLNFFFAGQETTAITLSCALAELVGHANVLARATEEVRSLEADEMTSEANLPYLAAVVRETLRLYPPVWTVARTALEEIEIAGLRLPVGTMVLLPLFVTQRLAEHWPDPDRFDPGRFDAGRLDADRPSDTDSTRHRFAFAPFSLGPRTCVGNHFAVHQILVVLASLLRTVRPVASPHANIVIRSHGVLQLSEPLWMRLQPHDPT